jgi:hypothetical protein
MPYANEIDLLKASTFNPTLLVARFWEIYSQVQPGGTGVAWQEREVETVSLPVAPGRLPFAFGAGPGSPIATRNAGVSVDAGWTASDGLMFRTGAFASLPAGPPADPDGFIDLLLFDVPPILQADLASSAPAGETFVDEVVNVLGATVTVETTITGASVAIRRGELAITATGTMLAQNNLWPSTPFDYVVALTLNPSRSVRDTGLVVEVGTAGPGTLTFGTPVTVLGFLQSGVLNALSRWIETAVRPRVRQTVEDRVNASALSQAASAFGSSTGSLPNGVILSAFRVVVGTIGGVAAVRVIACMGCFGRLVARFPARPSSGPTCVLSALSLLTGGGIDLGLFRTVRDLLLSETPNGGRIVAAYRAMSPELADILRAHSALAEEAATLAHEFQIALESGIRSPHFVDRAFVLVGKLEHLASPALRTQLVEMRRAMPVLWAAH